MLLTSLTFSLNSLTLSTPFLHGTTSSSQFLKPASTLSLRHPRPFIFCPTVRAEKVVEGKVVCATNNKTVSVEVTRFVPHPKYKKKVRKTKNFQAHDPDNKFKVGDFVQLQKCRPISKTKSYLAIPIPPRMRNVKKKAEEGGVTKELGIPLESEQKLEA